MNDHNHWRLVDTVCIMLWLLQQEIFVTNKSGRARLSNICVEVNDPGCYTQNSKVYNFVFLNIRNMVANKLRNSRKT